MTINAMTASNITKTDLIILAGFWYLLDIWVENMSFIDEFDNFAYCSLSFGWFVGAGSLALVARS